ncbi:MAG: nSTAND1 domain-containing NTPase [Actinomycetota bacterium]
MTTVDYRILGPFEVVDNGAPLDLGAVKQRALLAMLVLHPNEIVSSDRLIEAIWGDDPPRTVTHSIQIYVSELRKLLAGRADTIETRPPGYLLRVEPEQIDAHRFDELRRRTGAQALRSALELWRGEPLADFTFESFAQSHIRRLEEARAAAIEELGEAEISGGDGHSALPLLFDLADRQPLREGVRRLLMISLYRTGRQAEALRVYRDYRRSLGEELGIDPSPALQQLEEQILLQDPAIAGGSSPAAPTGTNWVDARNPYKGLRSFGEADAGDFFGRETLIAELMAGLDGGQRLVAVVGASGSGKSSVVRAGLLPRLRAKTAGRWLIATMLPGRHPFEELQAALNRATGDPRAPTDQVGSGDSGLVRTALRILPTEDSKLILLIDQFEELFTLTDQSTRRRFLKTLVTASGDPHDRIRLILTLRADFYDRPLVHGGFARRFADGVVTVTPLTSSELEASVLEPARSVGTRVASDLLAELIGDMAHQPGALPLFQYVLTELFEQRTGPELTLADYRRVGGLGGALTRTAEETFSGLEPGHQDLARRIFLHLVRIEHGAHGIRRRVGLSELRRLASDPDAVDEVILAFGSPRLLLFDRDPIAGNPTAEVTHEALLAEWPRLRDWIADRRIDLQRREALVGAAAEWELAGRDPDYLLTGSRLALLAQWREDADIGLGEAEIGFLEASLERRRAEEDAQTAIRAESERQRRRARRRTASLVAGVGLVAAALTFAAPTLLDPVLNPPPNVALAFWGVPEATDPYQRQFRAGFEQWISESGQVGETIGLPDTDELFFAIERLAERGTPLVLVGHPDADDLLLATAEAYPETHFVALDRTLGGPPNMTGVGFREEEGSILAGVVGALRSQTGRLGFVGGCDAPLIWRFHAGFEAGARAEDPAAEVTAHYIAPYYDASGFGSISEALETAEEMYRAGIDVIYHAAGFAGYGVFQAAATLTPELGRHLWAIGVDEDQYLAAPDTGFFPPFTPEQWPAHILTSMVKRLDNSTYRLLSEFAAGTLQPGVLSLGLAEEGVDLATSGGFIDPYRPALDRFREAIVSGSLVVPEMAEASVAQTYAAALAGLVAELEPTAARILIDSEFAEREYPADRSLAPVAPWIDQAFGPFPNGMVELDKTLPSQGEVRSGAREVILRDVRQALPGTEVEFVADPAPRRCSAAETTVAISFGAGRWQRDDAARAAVLLFQNATESGWYLVVLGFPPEGGMSVMSAERLPWEAPPPCG